MYTLSASECLKRAKYCNTISLYLQSHFFSVVNDMTYEIIRGNSGVITGPENCMYINNFPFPAYDVSRQAIIIIYQLWLCIAYSHFELSITNHSYSIDPLHVMSQGACSGSPWRTTGAVFYGENVEAAFAAHLQRR